MKTHHSRIQNIKIYTKRKFDEEQETSSIIKWMKRVIELFNFNNRTSKTKRNVLETRISIRKTNNWLLHIRALTKLKS
uniref:Uncharacterized protein n=1 Tax=Cucumis melo TaxID=3656 RepID=A0A9I9EI19_CUCME